MCPWARKSRAFWRIQAHIEAGSSRSGRNNFEVVSVSFLSVSPSFLLRTTLFQSYEQSALCWSIVHSSTDSSRPEKRKDAAVISEMMSRNESKWISESSSMSSSVNFAMRALILSTLTFAIPKVWKASIISGRSRDPPPSLSIISKSSPTLFSNCCLSDTLPMMRTRISLSWVAFADWYFSTRVLKRTLLSLTLAMCGTE
mmetsp:Transcript_2070/g.4648  ORF Transcript_2070/g.4648 Transcript_2070/m.4648 type:complete len:200 (+) Transcript_2070:1887-2486(+)